MSTKPLVSVIIPVFNGARTVAATIESALRQRYDEPFEVIVVNDASTDDTARIVASVGDRVRLINRDRQGGVAAATNTGAHASRGQYLAFLHADDTWMPDKLAHTVPLLEGDPETVLVYHDATETDETGLLTKHSHYPAGHNAAAAHHDLLENRAPATVILVPTVVMRRSTYDACDGFSEDVGCAEDLWMWVLASEHGRFRFVPEVLACRRFMLTERREQWYLDGAIRFEEMMRGHYGREACGNYTHQLLVSFALAASARGDRRKARGYYLRAVRRNPASFKTWVRLAWNLAPLAVSRGISRSLPESLRRSLSGPPSGGLLAFDTPVARPDAAARLNLHGRADEAVQ
jgi:glycosyltransferase involved in cell wall biosynthesis